MRKLRILFIAWIVSWQLSAQYHEGFGLAFSLGAQSMDASQVSAFHPGMNNPGDVGVVFGFYMYGQIERLTLGWKFNGYISEFSDKSNYTISNSAGNFLVEVGYKVLNKERLSLYPFVAGGFGGLTTTRTVEQNVDLANGMPDADSFSASWGNAVFDAGFRLERIFSMRNVLDGDRAGFMFGLEAGYQFTPESSNWKTFGGNAVLNAPACNLNGWFLKATFGSFSGK